MVKEKITVLVLILSLAAGCTQAGPSAPTLQPSDTAAPTLTNRPTHTAQPTDTPIPPTQTSLPPTATLLPTATRTPIQPTLYPAPGGDTEIVTWGGETNDWAYDVLLLADGGTLVAGMVNNPGMFSVTIHGNARLLRTDASGAVLWERDYGGEADTLFYSLIQVGEDEFVVLGTIAASTGRHPTNFYLVKIDGAGNPIWSRTYGGPGMDDARMVRQTSDGGFILAGDRADDFPTSGQYENNLILIKTDAEGNEVWSHTYGDSILYMAWGVAETPDGGFVVAGWEARNHEHRDVFAIKTDASGEMEWSRSWALASRERNGGFDMILTRDGYIVIAGVQAMNQGPRRAAVVKVDLLGNEVWVRAYADQGMGAEFWDVMEDTDGGYILSGDKIVGRDPTSGEDIRRGLVLKTDADGEVLWTYALLGNEYRQTVISSATVLSAGVYVFVGMATRNTEPYSDMLWLKLTLEE